MTAVNFPALLGGDGHSYSDDGTGERDMQLGGHRLYFMPLLQQAINMALSAYNSATTAVNAPGTNGTSATGLTIGTGAQAFTTQTGKSWAVGQPVMIANTAAPATNWMFGIITAYNSGTGAMTVQVSASAGAGTLAAWTISLCGPVISYNSSPYVALAAIYTALVADRGTWFECTGTWSMAFTAAATLGNGWWCYVANPGTGVITLDPNGAETVNGAATLTIQSGELWLVLCTGTGFQARLISFGNTYNAKAGNYTAAQADKGGTLEFTAAATLSYTAVATLGDSWSVTVLNSSGVGLLHDPNGSELIGGAGTQMQPPGSVWLIVADGAAFKVVPLNPGVVYQNDTAFTATGTAPNFVLTPTKPLLAYQAGVRYRIKFPSGGAGNDQLNVSGLGYKALKQYDPTGAKVAATIASQLADVEYDGVDFVVLDPLPPVIKQIQPIAASVSANSLTLTLNPNSLDFRSTTLTNGVPNNRTFNSAVSLVVPSGATLGTVSGQASRLVVLAIDNAGTVEPAVMNLAGGVNLDETGLINTTAISAAANSNNVIYSTTARTGVPYRIEGFVDITEAAAGTWATGPTLVQGQGGQALSAMSSIGYGQSYQNFTVGSTRVLGNIYYNIKGKPITLLLSGISGVVSITINGSVVYSSSVGFLSIVIPPFASYSVTVGTSLGRWDEFS